MNGSCQDCPETCAADCMVDGASCGDVGCASCAAPYAVACNDGCVGACGDQGLFGLGLFRRAGRRGQPVYGQAAYGQGMPMGPGAATYPYYMNRGPRDFLAARPPSIGP